jgi:hypothetical protein
MVHKGKTQERLEVGYLGTNRHVVSAVPAALTTITHMINQDVEDINGPEEPFCG